MVLYIKLISYPNYNAAYQFIMQGNTQAGIEISSDGSISGNTMMDSKIWMNGIVSGTNTPLSKNTWHVLAVVATSTRLDFYVDGSSSFAWGSTTPITFTNTTETISTICGCSLESSLDMQLGGAMSFDYPMSQTQVSQVTTYFQGLTNANFASLTTTTFGQSTP